LIIRQKLEFILKGRCRALKYFRWSIPLLFYYSTCTKRDGAKVTAKRKACSPLRIAPLWSAIELIGSGTAIRLGSQRLSFIQPNGLLWKESLYRLVECDFEATIPALHPLLERLGLNPHESSSPDRFSTPKLEVSRICSCHCGSLSISRATVSSFKAWSISAWYATGILKSARDHLLERLATILISLLGIVIKRPSASRNWVIRIQVFHQARHISDRNHRPGRTGLQDDQKAVNSIFNQVLGSQETATPIRPAPASKGPMFIPV